MGIKDNFSQAVKELWKKDGQDGEMPQNNGNQPSELDKYLRDPDDSTQSAVSMQSNAQPRETNSNGVPLETPYFPSNDASVNNNNNADDGQQPVPVQPAAPVQQNVPKPVSEAPETQAMNRNAANAVNNNANAVNNVSEPVQQNNGYVQDNRNISQNFGQNNVNNAYSNNNGYVNNGGYNGNGYNNGYNNNNFNNGYNNNNFNNGYNNGYGNNGYNNNAPAYNQNVQNAVNQNGRFVPPPNNNGGMPDQVVNETEETTIISKNTSIEGNIRSLANMTVDGNIKGNLETTRNVDMTGKIVGDIVANNAALNSAAMQGNVSLKGRMKMDRDTILIGDLSSQYADINGRIRGKLDIVGKAELKRDAIVFGDINASTIAVTDGAIIQGYVNTTFLSKDDSRNVFPDAISIEEQKQQQSARPNAQAAQSGNDPMNPNSMV